MEQFVQNGIKDRVNIYPVFNTGNSDCMCWIVGPVIYLAATFIVLIVGWISIRYQTIKAANYNPAKVLKVE
jgi:hypothetical protein